MVAQLEKRAPFHYKSTLWPSHSLLARLVSEVMVSSLYLCGAARKNCQTIFLGLIHEMAHLLTMDVQEPMIQTILFFV